MFTFQVNLVSLEHLDSLEGKDNLVQEVQQDNKEAEANLDHQVLLVE